MDVCVNPSLPLQLNLQNTKAEPPPNGTGAKLLEWNLFTASSCQLMEILDTMC